MNHYPRRAQRATRNRRTSPESGIPRLASQPPPGSDVGVNPERILGVDPGAARVGLALSDEIGFLAHPFRTLAVKGGDCLTSAPEIAAAAAETGASTVVVGLPRNMNGTYGPAAEKSRALAEKLATLTPARIVLWDERLTTAAASRRLHEAGRNAREQRGMIDRAAAVQILQDWLDARSATG